MRKNLSRIFFSFLALALAGWAFYEYKQSQKEREQQERAAVFFDRELESLKAFRVTKAGGKILEVKKEGEDWLVRQPIQDLADFAEISRWFNEIKNQKVQKIQTDKDISWKDYYLEKAPLVRLEFSSGQSLSFSVSGKSSFDGKYFIKKGEDLLLGESYFYSEVNEVDFDSFRSGKLLQPLGHATKIQFQGPEAFALDWENYSWSLSEDQSFPLDSSRLDGFWTDINSIKSSAFKERVRPESLKKYGLNKPQLKIQFSYPEKDKSVTLKLSPFQGEKAFVFVSHRRFILEISKEDAKKLLLSKKDFRDHAFPFNYKADSVAQVERRSGKKSLAIKKEGQVWRALGEKDKAVSVEKAEELLDQIKELRGEKYKKSAVLGKNPRFIKMTTAKGDLVFELKEASAGGALSWVKTNLWPEWTAVPKKSLDEIFSLNIFSSSNSKNKAEQKEPQKPP